MSEEEIRDKIRNDPSFINAKRFDFKIGNLEEKFPDGCPDHVIADVLMIPAESIESEMAAIVEKMRTSMGVVL